MARVTVEDCIEKVPNRFQLVLLAGHRARMIRAGSEMTVERDDDKDPVVSLREIAGDGVDLELVKESYVSELQEVRPNEEAEKRRRPSGTSSCTDSFGRRCYPRLSSRARERARRPLLII